MDLEENYLLEDDFGQFRSLDLLSSADLNFSDDMDQGNDQLADIIRSLDFDLESDSDKLGDVVDNIMAFDATTFDSEFGNQMFCDNYSPSTSDSGNYSPTYSTSDEPGTFENERTNVQQPAQVHHLEKQFAPVPDPSRLVPVQIPIQKIVADGKKYSSHPVICIMPATTNSSPLNTQTYASQRKQRLLSPKREVSSPAQTFITSPSNAQAAVFGATNNAFNTLSNTGATYIQPPPTDPLSSVGDIRVDYDRKKEDRKIRNRYSAQLSRIRKRNEIEEMKRSLANKDVVIEKLRSEIDDLKKAVEILRKENEILKSGANKRQNKSRLGMVTGATCLFAIISLFSFSSTYTKNLDPTQDATSLITLSPAKTEGYALKSKTKTGRTLLSYDYEGSTEYTSRGKPRLSRQANSLSQPNSNVSANCDSAQKKFLNHTEAMRLNDDVFAWVNRHECLHFMHIRRIFRVPLYSRWETPNVLRKSTQKIVRNKRVNREKRRRKTAGDKREDARIKAVRERAWRHIDMISPSGDRAAMKPQMKTVDYDVSNRGHVIGHWLQRKADALTVLNMESQYAELARSLKQREDTLYVVAMKDYYLLPPTDRNGTMQPRMALILPALFFNGTLPNQVAMMRLECDITGTGLFHLPDSLLPLFYDRTSRQ